MGKKKNIGETIDNAVNAQSKKLKKRFREEIPLSKAIKYLKKKIGIKDTKPKKKTTKKKINPEIVKFKNKVVDSGVDLGTKFFKDYFGIGKSKDKEKEKK